MEEGRRDEIPDNIEPLGLVRRLGLRTIEYYVRVRRTPINDWVQDQPIMKMCRSEEGMRGFPPHLYWWE